MNTNIVKTDPKTLAPEQYNRLFNSKYGVGNIGNRVIQFPLKLRILQKNTNDRMFEDNDSIGKKDYGRLFIEPNSSKNPITNEWEYSKKLKISDLKPAMGFTLLMREEGAEILKLTKNPKGEIISKKCVCKYSAGKKAKFGGMDKATKKAFYDSFGEDDYKIQNEMKLVLVSGTYEEMEEKMQNGENPFVQVTLAGGNGWLKIWKDMKDQMTELIHNINPDMDAGSVLNSMWRITFSSQLMKGQLGNEYYMLVPTVTMNDFEEAGKFCDLVEKLYEEFSFFRNSQNADLSLLDFEIEGQEVPIEGVKEAIDAEVEDEQTAEEIAKKVAVEDSQEEPTEGDPLEEDMPF